MGDFLKSPSVDGVVISPLKIITDERGSVLHMLKSNEPLFDKFGEIYFSEILSGTVKAWKKNKKQSQNLTVPVGMVNLVIYDDRRNSKTRGNFFDCLLGRPDNYYLIHIPPMLWYGFQSLDNQKALIANCTDQPHNPLESESIPIDSGKIPFQWDSKK